jgi:photosystem II stability/assembly factor-like uncharacterized protein
MAITPRQGSSRKPILVLNPPRAAAGMRIIVRGADWGVCPVSLSIGEEEVSPARILQGFPEPGQVKPDAHGRFVVVLAIPDDLRAGEYRVVAIARGRKGETCVEARMQVVGNNRPAGAGGGRDDDPWGRSRSFLERRVGSGGSVRIPRLCAWQDVQRLRKLRDGRDRPPPSPPTIPGCNWTPVGASVVINGQTQDAQGRSAPVSGRVDAIAIDPLDPDNTIYVGTAQGGLWKTADGGQTWVPKSDFQPSLSAGAIAIDRSNGRNRLFVGTGEDNFSGDSYYGAGILRSDDGGDTWSLIGSPVFSHAHIGRIIIDPNDSTHILIASNIGVFESHNTGTNWTNLRSGNATDLLLDSSNAANPRVYAGFAGDGIYLRLGAGNFALLSSPALPSPAFRITLAMCAGTPQTIYAAFGTLAAPPYPLQGIYQTADGGNTWQAVGIPGGTAQTWYNLVLAVHPTNPQIVYFGEVHLWQSTDGGATWTDITIGQPAPGQPGIHADQHAFAIHPMTPTTVWAGNDGGIWFSTDGGGNWFSRNRGMQTLQYQTMAQHPQWAAVILAGSQDNGSQRYAGHPGWTLALVGDGGVSAIDPGTPTRWYQGQARPNALGIWRSDSAGDPASWNLKNNGINNGDRFLFYPPFTLDPSSPNILYYGSNNLYQSTDNADTWAAITGDLTAGGEISAIAVAPNNSNIVYVGTSDGKFWQLTWNGSVWVQTDYSHGLPGVYIADIAVDPTNQSTAYVVIGALESAGAAAEFGIDHVWSSSTGGATWTEISAGLSQNNPVNSIVVDPANVSRLFIGCDVGIFRSENQGLTWTEWDDNLPNVAVFDLKLHNASRLLRTATHGRSIWERPIDAVLCSAVDIYVRDDIVDVGRDIPSPSGVADPFLAGQTDFWYESKDIKLDTPAPAYQTPAATIDYVTFEQITHRNPQQGVTSRVYVQVHNRGPNTVDSVQVRPFWSNAGAGLQNVPLDFWTAFPNADPSNTSTWHLVGPTQTIKNLVPAEPQVVEWDWDVPSDAPQHSCMLAVITSADDPVSESGLDPNVFVTGNKHITLKNLHVDSAGSSADPRVRGPYFLDFATLEGIFDVVFLPEFISPGTRIWFHATPFRIAATRSMRDALIGVHVAKTPGVQNFERPEEQCGDPTRYDLHRAFYLDIATLDRPIGIRGIQIESRQKFSLAIFLQLPGGLNPGRAIRLHAQQHRNGRMVGGSVYEVIV